MQPEEKERATAAFLRSFMEALIGDWEHGGEAAPGDNQRERERERERHTHTHAPTTANDTLHDNTTLRNFMYF